MCLSTVYVDYGNKNDEIMKDVARIEAEGTGFWLINLFGEKKFIEGKLRAIDLVDGHSVIFRSSSPD
jgi:predicted RNA-binding protein